MQQWWKLGMIWQLLNSNNFVVYGQCGYMLVQARLPSVDVIVSHIDGAVSLRIILRNMIRIQTV